MNANKKISCITIDEESECLEILKNFISAVPFLQLAASFKNSLEAFLWMYENVTDLVFVEMKMSILSGEQLVKAFKNPPGIIFTTSQEKYALAGFEPGATDFLLKPFSFERFTRAINKFTSSSPLQDSSGETIRSGKWYDFRYFKTERKMVKVYLDDILFIESIRDYIKVVTKNGTIVTRQSISSMEDLLPKHLFFRIHRSYIVSFKNIDCFTTERIEIAKYSLPVSRPYRHEMENRLR
jgi:DNA-binding LytR/AlgR family response regulator